MTCNWEQFFWQWAAHFTTESFQISLYAQRFKAVCTRRTKAAQSRAGPPPHFTVKAVLFPLVCFMLVAKHRLFFTCSSHRLSLDSDRPDIDAQWLWRSLLVPKEIFLHSLATIMLFFPLAVMFTDAGWVILFPILLRNWSTVSVVHTKQHSYTL